ncbi:unnamed protein product [marine sediment metagenome]|uniref:Homeodomain phBC6A51-type domain-containing protein n=1 Tax=marine sediment metagenome TaxID=412755 RepID=X0S777_9ZZZZ
MTTRTENFNTEISKYNIEFSTDDELVSLVHENTHAKMPRAITNTLKCLTLIAGGSAMSTACKLTGVAYSTLSGWRSKEWYSRAIELIQKRLDDQLDGKMTSILNKGIAKLEQRLDVGDGVLQKDGTMAYKPVTAKDAAIITSIFFDKRNLLRNKPTSISTKVSTDERLNSLANKFKDIASETIDITEYEEITEGEVVDEQSTEFLDQQERNNEQRLEAQTTTDNTETDGRQLEPSFQERIEVESTPKDSNAWCFSGA